MSDDPSGKRANRVFESADYADMRPVYRAMMRRLKQQDAVLFDAATAHYEQVVAPALAAKESNPLATWVEYGAWLARKLAPGRLVRLDETGYATNSEVEPVPGQVLLYLPDEKGESAIPLLRPAEPSRAQKAALGLLVR